LVKLGRRVRFLVFVGIGVGPIAPGVTSSPSATPWRVVPTVPTARSVRRTVAAAVGWRITAATAATAGRVIAAGVVATCSGCSPELVGADFVSVISRSILTESARSS
jgi:hypothetical protein